MKNQLEKTLITLLPAVFVVALGLPAAAADGSTHSARCEALLEAAHQALDTAAADGDHGRGSERARDAFEAAFAECGAPRALPLDLGARVAAERASFLTVFDKSPGDAVEVLEEALEWSAARGGLRHPSRVVLLQGLVEALHAESVAAGTDEALEAAVARGHELLAEALSVRQAAYGEESLEAAEGHVRLAAAFVHTQPILAEQHARRALEIASEKAGMHHRQVASALGMLDVALRRQGRTEEADAVTEQLAGALHALEKPSGSPM